MKRGVKYLFLVVLLLLVSNITLSQIATPEITGISVQSDGSIKVQWRMTSENGVSYYEVYRSPNSNGTFTLLGRVAKGTLYYIDKSDLFKVTDQFLCYKVAAVGVNEIKISNVMGVAYRSPSSTAKRTWGSIKAMFR